METPAPTVLSKIIAAIRRTDPDLLLLWLIPVSLVILTGFQSPAALRLRQSSEVTVTSHAKLLRLRWLQVGSEDVTTAPVVLHLERPDLKQSCLIAEAKTLACSMKIDDLKVTGATLTLTHDGELISLNLPTKNTAPNQPVSDMSGKMRLSPEEVQALTKYEKSR